MAHILIADGMAQEAVELLVSAGHTVDNRTCDAEDLLASISNYDGLVVRSASIVTPEVIAAGAPRLKIIGRAGVGVDNIDKEAATASGVIVMNAPLGNILSAAEHTIGMIFAVCRNIPQAHALLANGTWDKKSHIGAELYDKTLGIVGLGKIGKHVAHVLQAAGMKVIAYDPFLTEEVATELGIESVSVESLIERSDVMTLHTPLTDQTRNLINADAFKRMKKTARIVNVARGGIINEHDLVDALTNGDIAAAALDVFGTEPLPADSPLIGCPRLVTTPHLGASTAEAQTKVSVDIADQFNAFFESGKIINAVNVQLRVDPAIDGYMKAAEELGAMVAQSAQGPISELEVRARGDLASFDTKPLSISALKGALSQITTETVNAVNAQLIAKQRGITLTSSSTEQMGQWQAHLALRATTNKGVHIIGGSVVNGSLRVLRFDDFRLDLPVDGNLLILQYQDLPGMVGTYGTILGDNNINIARMEVCRNDGRGDALVILTLDDPIPDTVLDQVKTAIKPTLIYGISL